MRKLTIICMLACVIWALAKYSIVPVVATNDTINNNSVWCIDRHNEYYLVDNVTPGKGYTIIIDRHDIFNTEDNEILYVR